MALSCILNGNKVMSFAFSNEQWLWLKQNYKKHHLMSQCCGQPMVPKTSPGGLQFFAHKNINAHSCGGSGETVQHQFCKYIIAKTLARLGWAVEVEKRGITPNGDIWVADVYAEKLDRRVVFEVQWSPQSYAKTLQRQKLYEKSNVECYWLLRGGAKGGVPLDYMVAVEMLPVFELLHDQGEMKVGVRYLSLGSRNFFVSVDGFVQKVVDNRLVQIHKNSLITEYIVTHKSVDRSPYLVKVTDIDGKPINNEILSNDCYPTAMRSTTHQHVLDVRDALSTYGKGWFLC